MDSSKPTVMLKFTGPQSASSRQREIRKWLGDDLVDSRPLFPDEDDETLSTIFEVYLKDDAQADVVIKKLQSQAAVEYAHVPAERVSKRVEPGKDSGKSA